MRKQTKRLALNKETIRDLDEKHLERAVGGATGLTDPCIPYSEWFTCWCIDTLQ